MEIRMLKLEEILDALHFVWETYVEQEVPHRYATEIHAFQNSIKYQKIMRPYEKKELYLFGAFEQQEFVGVSAITNIGYIKFLYAKSGSSMEDIKENLLQFLKQFGILNLGLHTLKVEADEKEEVFYRQKGFIQFGQRYTQDGRYVKPLETVTRETNFVSTARQSKNSTVLGIIIILSILTALFLFVAGFVLFSTRTIVSDITNRNQTEEVYEEEPEGDAYDDFLEETGIDSINAYAAENLQYTVEEKSFTESQYERKHIIDFQVAFPQFINLNQEQAEKINQNIKLTAMQTANEWYYEADEKKKEKMLSIPYPCLVSYVDYNTSYLSNSFASILFEDKCYKGDYATNYIELRAQNINLTTGENYQVKDIIVLNNVFMEKWFEIMNQEAPNAAALLGVTTEEFQKILEGETMTANNTSYAPTFFVYDGGIEIGFHYKAKSGDTGWITAPFTFEEVLEFKTDSSFWTLF